MKDSPARKSSSEVPSKPKVLDEVAIAILEDGVLVDGFAQLEVIRGPVAQTLLPALFGLLDGTRTSDELVAAFPAVPAEYIHDAISYLYECGVIEDAHLAGPVPRAHAETLAFLRRVIGGSQIDSTVAESYSRLQNARVGLLASEDYSRVATVLEILLRDSGVQTVEVIHDHGLARRRDSGDLLVVLEDGEALSAALRDANGWIHDQWLRAGLDSQSGEADVGPYFKRGQDACYYCFSATHIGLRSSPASEFRERSQIILATSLATEIVWLLALPGLALARRTFRRIQMQDLSSRVLAYPRVPGCAHCRPKSFNFVDRVLASHPQPRHLIDTAIVFEDYLGLDAQKELNRSRRDRHRTVDSMQTIEGYRFLNCEMFPLAAKPLTLNTSVTHISELEGAGLSSGLNVDDLAALLALTAGLREKQADGTVRRWAATAGNLGSVELGVAVRKVDGLCPGFYFYKAEDHSLAAFRKRSASSLDDFMRRCIRCQNEDLPDALIVFNAALRKVFPKYGAFGYKLIYLDAGAALSQLQYVSRGMGLSCRAIPRWADDLIETEFNLDCGMEQCAAVVDLSRRLAGKRFAPSFTRDHFLPARPPRSWHHISDEFKHKSVQDVMERLYSESRVTEAEVSTAPFETPKELTARHLMSQSRKLPRPAEPRYPLGYVLHARKSIRRYTAEPIPASYLHSMLRTAAIGDSAEWIDENQSHNNLKLIILVRAIAGLSPGIYIYQKERGSLGFRRELPHEERMRELFVQPEFAEAPLFIWITGNLAVACSRYGAFGHRQLLLRAGTAGHRLWTTAIALGLSGCLVAGLVPGAARTILDLDGYENSSLLGFASGYEETEPLSR